MSIRTTLRLLYVCLCSLWLMSCGSKRESKETEIIIISLNDVHGNFDNLAKISAYIQKTRAEHEHVIVADAGDRFTGNPFNDFHELTQAPIIDLLNTMGVDISVIGNHEFDYGIGVLKERLQKAEFIEVLANMDLRNTGMNKLITPYHVFDMGGVEVGFLGLVCIDRLTGKPPALLDHMIDFTFYDPIETAIKHRNSLQKGDKKPDVYIALTHIGLDMDYRLADAVPEFDLIIGGHSHYLTVEPEFRNDVKILATDRHGDHIFKTTIRVKDHEVVSISTELIPTSTLTDKDPVMVEKIKHYENNPFLTEQILTLKHPFNEEQLGFLLVDAAISLPGVELSIMNCGGVRADTLKAGPISYADLLRVYPFSNHYGIVDLKPSEIRMIIEQEYEIPKRCHTYPGGFSFVKDTINNITKILKLIDPNGKELDENRTYSVVLNSFLLSRHFFNRRDEVKVLPIFVIDNLVGYLKRNPNVDYRKAPRRAIFTQHS